MKASTKNRVAGTFRTVKGCVKIAIGSLVNSRRVSLAGRIDKTAGTIQAKFGRAERVFGM